MEVIAKPGRARCPQRVAAGWGQPAIPNNAGNRWGQPPRNNCNTSLSALWRGIV